MKMWCTPVQMGSDTELVSYVEFHSHTELALVHVDQCRRFYALAGKHLDTRRSFLSMTFSDIKQYLGKARQQALLNDQARCIRPAGRSHDRRGPPPAGAA